MQARTFISTLIVTMFTLVVMVPTWPWINPTSSDAHAQEPSEDTEPPVIELVTVIEIDTDIILEVEVTDNVTVAYVMFYRWDPVESRHVILAKDDTESYQVTIPRSTLLPEYNQIYILASDTSGNVSNLVIVLLYFLNTQPIFLPLISK
jgi:hypothetical protein